MRRISLLMAVAICVLSAGAQGRPQTTEKIEWTWSDRPEPALASLPNVLLVGDSITRNYYPAVVQGLSGVANVYLFATSLSSGDPRLAHQLKDYFAALSISFAIIHFNNGMHGWGFTEPQFADGLPEMIEALRAGSPRTTLEWANTTPVLHDSPSGGSTNPRIDERNRLAAAWMGRQGISIDDQHALMLKHPELHAGDVHFTTEGSALQAAQVAAMIRGALAKQ